MFYRYTCRGSRIATPLPWFRTLKEDAMPAPLSVDLPERVVAAVAAGEKITPVSRRFDVTQPTIEAWLAWHENPDSEEPWVRASTR